MPTNAPNSDAPNIASTKLRRKGLSSLSAIKAAT